MKGKEIYLKKRMRRKRQRSYQWCLEIKGIAMVDLCNVAIKDVTGQN